METLCFACSKIQIFTNSEILFMIVLVPKTVVYSAHITWMFGQKHSFAFAFSSFLHL